MTTTRRHRSAEAGTDTEQAEGREDPQGRDAERPGEIPARGWKNVLLGVKDGAKRQRLPLVGAGVAFYAMVALVPALAAVVSMYGLVSDPADVARHVESIAAAAPQEVSDLVLEQLTRLSSGGQTSLGIGALVGVVVALWSASAGVRGLMDGVGIAYEESDERGFLRKRALSLLLTLGAILMAVFALGLIVVLPAVMDRLPLGRAGTILASILRWPLLGIAVVLALGVLYRLGPSREDARVRWISWGALAATLLWLAGSGLFSFYVSQFGKYNDTYGSLGAILVLLLWLWISALAVLLGARLNAELEHQTARDTTTGPEVPLGERQAEVADKVAPVRDGG